MSRQSITKDERFLLELMMLLQEEKCSSVQLSLMEKRLSLTHATAKNIASLLAQTGFISYSHKESSLSLKQKGISLCKLLQER
ncbi:MAG: hypothetical protein QRY74_03860 [Chlamydia sp.]